VLEPLFFGILNTKPEGRKQIFEQYNWDMALLKEWESIPYLNGGLFERDKEDEPESKFPADYFKRLFQFFSEYNFTIDENDPNDAEVGVDPEMLGKIFENLLEDNKDKGAFYTPKEIVRYMCQESLIAYLETNTSIAADKLRNFVLSPEESVVDIPQQKRPKLIEALQNVKICDPAIGSGAFPMGLLNELLRCREALSSEHYDRAELKKSIIQNNIYGVDIEKGAVDIARLRFWLSIVVDEDTPSPLPNLDYKIMQGNSLIESFEGVDLSKLTYEK
jgi:type I restriction-modification system DNA methylase subunit